MRRILIIDANVPFRKSLKTILANRFQLVDIEEAADGKEGADRADTFHPNLIFIDIHLPDENGLRLARRIKSFHPNIIIILLTNYYLPEYKTAVENSGIEYLVPKDDWTGEDMISLVQLILSDLNSDEPGIQNGNWPQGQSS